MSRMQLSRFCLMWHLNMQMNGFKQCGLFIKADYAFLATSTDGLFVCAVAVQLYLQRNALSWSKKKTSIGKLPTNVSIFWRK